MLSSRLISNLDVFAHQADYMWNQCLQSWILLKLTLYQFVYTDRDGRSDRHLMGGIMTDRPVKYSSRHNNGGIRQMDIIDEPYGSNCIVDERILQHRAEKERRLTRAAEKPEGNTGFFQK